MRLYFSLPSAHSQQVTQIIRNADGEVVFGRGVSLFVGSTVYRGASISPIFHLYSVATRFLSLYGAGSGEDDGRIRADHPNGFLC